MKKSQTQINDIQQEINEKVANHLDVANSEMGVIKNDILWIKEKLGNFEQRFDKLDGRVWWILGTIVMGFLINIYFK